MLMVVSDFNAYHAHQNHDMAFFFMVLDKNMAVAVKPAEEVTAKKKPLMKQRRVVVTGMGVVTPVGHDLDVFYNNLLEGVSGISEIEAFDCTQFPTVGHYQFFGPCSDG